MDWEVWESYLDRDILGYFHHWIKAWRPTVQVEPLSSHEIRSISEDEISIFLRDEFKDKEASSYRIAGYTILDQRALVSLGPVVCGPG
jgi:hypothetical protein